MTIKSFDRNNARTVQAEMLAAMKVVADRHGLTVRPGKGGLSTSEISLSFVLACEVDKTAFLTEVKRMKLDTTKAAEGYMLVGLNGSPKNRWEVKKIRGGKNYVIDDAQALRWFGPAAQITANRTTLANDVVFGVGATKSMEEYFFGLVLRLEPENLTCDGELSSSQIRDRRTRINQEWKALEARYGRKVSIDETWGFAPKTTAN